MRYLVFITLILGLAFSSCTKKGWQQGEPLAKEKIKIGVVHITDPFSETSGYAYSHQKGIEDMKQAIGLKDSQILYKTNINDFEPLEIESAMRELIARGVNIIIATSWGYMDSCEKLADEFPEVLFAHASGYKYNFTNFTNYFGKVYQARYLAGLVAGMKTESDKIGFVAAWGTDNSEVTGGLNAFAMGVEKVNPHATIHVKINHSWFDPMGEMVSTRALLAEGCDIIAQHCDTPIPQKEAQKAGVWGIGYNTDMSADAPDAVLTSVIWNWGAYYITMIQGIMNGTFSTMPWYGSLKDGIVDIAPLSNITTWEPKMHRIIDDERKRIESETSDVFSGIMETNDGKRIGKEGENLADEEIRNGIDWYYRNVVVVK